MSTVLSPPWLESSVCAALRQQPIESRPKIVQVVAVVHGEMEMTDGAVSIVAHVVPHRVFPVGTILRLHQWRVAMRPSIHLQIESNVTVLGHTSVPVPVPSVRGSVVVRQAQTGWGIAPGNIRRLFAGASPERLAAICRAPDASPNPTDWGIGRMLVDDDDDADDRNGTTDGIADAPDRWETQPTTINATQELSIHRTTVHDEPRNEAHPVKRYKKEVLFGGDVLRRTLQ
jgi:hypothetical protein